MPKMNGEDKFTRWYARTDDMFERVEKMFDKFSRYAPFMGNGFSDDVVLDEETLNFSLEYKLVETPASFRDAQAVKTWLDNFGAAGWDLNCFEFGYAIFSRFNEEGDDDGKEKEPES